jgi:hypothetical protein
VNIFYLNKDPVRCAEEHCDKHTVKMIIEYAQLLSTAHRVLDGDLVLGRTQSNRSIKRWNLSDSRNDTLYLASHINHPDAIWARQSSGNYTFLYKLFVALCDEYTHRYGKIHATDTKLRAILATAPKNIPIGPMTQPPQAMPDHCKHSDAIQAYKNYYIMEKKRFATWKNREIPIWYQEGLNATV